MAWAPPPTMPQANVPLRQAPSNVARGVEGAVQGENSRGEITGDLCQSIDLFSTNRCVAFWDEKTALCKAQSVKRSTEVHFSSEGKMVINSTKQSQHGLTIRDLRNGVVVGEQGGLEREGSCYPLAGLMESDSVSAYGEVLSDPATALALPALTALLIDAVLQQQVLPASAAETISEGKPKKGKSKKHRSSTTLVCPAGFTQAQRATLLTAAELCGRSVKNLFDRGVAAVAGGLYQASQTAAASNAASKGKVAVAGDLLDVLCSQGAYAAGEEPLVLYMHLYALQGAADRLYYDAVLVRCEGRAGAAAVGAPLGFERLCTVAARGGRMGSTEGKAVRTELGEIVKLLLADAELTSSVSYQPQCNSVCYRKQ
jgi:hypothetical protein